MLVLISSCDCHLFAKMCLLSNAQLTIQVCCVLCITMFSSTLVLAVCHLGKGPNFKKTKQTTQPSILRQREGLFLLCKNKGRRMLMRQSWQKLRSIEMVKVVLRVTLQTTRSLA